jgi:hypothetical protein
MILFNQVPFSIEQIMITFCKLNSLNRVATINWYSRVSGLEGQQQQYHGGQKGQQSQ